MIDGIKILHLFVNIKELLNNNLLLFPLPFNEPTGEILNRARTSINRGLIFTIKNNNVKLNGSLHKYWNNGMHNYNDFYFIDLQKTVNEITIKFNIDAVNSILNNLEFGVNIHIKQEPEEVFKNIINYRGEPFHPFTIEGAKGIECITDNFYIKIYNKSYQYKQPGYILRYEIKVKKMNFFNNNKININSLSDLTAHSKISKLKRVLISVFNEILFTDYSINPDKLTPSNRLILSYGNNRQYWVNLKPKSKDFINGNKNKDYISNRKKYYRVLDKFKTLIKEHSTGTLQKDISFLIEKKCNDLLNENYKIVDKFPDCLTTAKNNESGQIPISYIVGNCPQEENSFRFCPVTGIDITMQKITSKFLSISGIKYIYENDKEKYSLLSRRLSSKWRDAPLETQFREIAHSIRNENNNSKLNPKNNLRRRLCNINNDGLLFDISGFIVLNDFQRSLINRINSIRSCS